MGREAEKRRSIGLNLLFVIHRVIFIKYFFAVEVLQLT